MGSDTERWLEDWTGKDRAKQRNTNENKTRV